MKKKKENKLIDYQDIEPSFEQPEDSLQHSFYVLFQAYSSQKESDILASLTNISLTIRKQSSIPPDLYKNDDFFHILSMLLNPSTPKTTDIVLEVMMKLLLVYSHQEFPDFLNEEPFIKIIANCLEKCSARSVHISCLRYFGFLAYLGPEIAQRLLQFIPLFQLILMQSIDPSVLRYGISIIMHFMQYFPEQSRPLFPIFERLSSIRVSDLGTRVCLYRGITFAISNQFEEYLPLIRPLFLIQESHWELQVVGLQGICYYPKPVHPTSDLFQLISKIACSAIIPTVRVWAVRAIISVIKIHKSDPENPILFPPSPEIVNLLVNLILSGTYKEQNESITQLSIILPFIIASDVKFNFEQIRIRKIVTRLLDSIFAEDNIIFSDALSLLVELTRLDSKSDPVESEALRKDIMNLNGYEPSEEIQLSEEDAAKLASLKEFIQHPLDIEPGHPPVPNYNTPSIDAQEKMFYSQFQPQ